jgi:hypothetical protein
LLFGTFTTQPDQTREVDSANIMGMAGDHPGAICSDGKRQPMTAV